MWFIDQVHQSHMVYTKKQICFTLLNSLKAYIIGWSYLLVSLYANIALTANNDAYVCTWNSNCQFGGIRIGASMYFYLIWS
jgi:hypothetical protein